MTCISEQVVPACSNELILKRIIYIIYTSGFSQFGRRVDWQEVLRGKVQAMTEPEWWACKEPAPMLAFLLGRPRGLGARLGAWLGRQRSPGNLPGPPRPSDRKLRLFACACGALITSLLRDGRCLDALATSERFAVGQADEEELEAARQRAWEAVEGLQPTVSQEYFVVAGGAGGEVGKLWPWAARATAEAAAPDAAEAALRVNAAIERVGIEWAAQGQAIKVILAALGPKVRARILRDIIGNPFRPVTLDPSWVTPGVARLAQAIFDERAFDRLAELADALEETACTNPEILGHCRRPGRHVRGCWVIDLALARV